MRRFKYKDASNSTEICTTLIEMERNWDQDGIFEEGQEIVRVPERLDGTPAENETQEPVNNDTTRSRSEAETIIERS
jgi:hypothetical protein